MRSERLNCGLGRAGASALLSLLCLAATSPSTLLVSLRLITYASSFFSPAFFAAIACCTYAANSAEGGDDCTHPCACSTAGPGRFTGSFTRHIDRNEWNPSDHLLRCNNFGASRLQQPASLLRSRHHYVLWNLRYRLGDFYSMQRRPHLCQFNGRNAKTPHIGLQPIWHATEIHHRHLRRDPVRRSDELSALIVWRL